MDSLSPIDVLQLLVYVVKGINSFLAGYITGKNNN